MQKLLETEEKTFFLLEPNISDECLRTEFQRLRYKHFVLKLKSEPKNNFGLEKDNYDDFSDYIVCVFQETRKIVGGCRIIRADRTVLPISKAVSVVHQNSIEISRFIAEDPFAKCHLYFLIHTYVLGRGIDYGYALARRGITRIMKKDEVNIFSIVGQEIRYNGLRLVPLMTSVTKIKNIVPFGLQLY